MGRKRTWDDARYEKLRGLWTSGASADEMADALGSSRGAIYQRAKKLGLPARNQRRGRPAGPRRVGKPDGARVSLDPWHPALAAGRTIHGRTVTPAARAKRLLKSGKWSSKIGDVAMKGKWKGFPLLTLTLEERATCPRTCLEWDTCYGNNLGHTTIERIFDDGFLELILHAEIARKAAQHPDGFAVRLHVLGDFYSVRYVEFWREMMREFDALHVFGFTARQPGDDIGRAVLEMMEEFDDRAMMRVSGAAFPQLCSEVVDSIDQARFIVCPAQRKADHDCARCGLCWTSDHSISFLRH